MNAFKLLNITDGNPEQYLHRDCIVNQLVNMGRFDQGVETQCQFAWCIARLVALVQKLVQQIDKLSGGSLQKK